MLAIVFFIIYTVFMFFILVNVFLAILNDAYATVKGEMEEEQAQAKLARAERLANNPPPSLMKRAQILQTAARGRFHRFQARVKNMARRRKVKPMTATDAIDSLYTNNGHVPSAGMGMR